MLGRMSASAPIRGAVPGVGRVSWGRHIAVSSIVGRWERSKGVGATGVVARGREIAWVATISVVGSWVSTGSASTSVRWRGCGRVEKVVVVVVVHGE